MLYGFFQWHSYRFKESFNESVAALVVSAPIPLVEVSGIIIPVLSAPFFLELLDVQLIAVNVPEINIINKMLFMLILGLPYKINYRESRLTVSRLVVSVGMVRMVLSGVVCLIEESIFVESASERALSCVDPQPAITVPANNRIKTIFDFIMWF